MTDTDAIAVATPLEEDRGAEGVLGRLADWSRTERRIRAVAIVGSRARVRDHPADKWADVDVLLMTTHPRHYLKTTGWLAALGDPWLTYLEETPVGDRAERRTVFAGAIEVDFVVLSTLEMRLAVHALGTLRRLPRLAPILPGRRLHQLDAVSDIVRRGMRVLIDKDGLATRLQRIRTALIPRLPPAEPVFHETVHRFWHWPIWAGKHLCRGELWRVKAVSEPRRNQVLLTMLEWHACVRNGWSYDTWDRGRFVEEWADPRAVRALRDLFGRYDRDDLWRSLWASMELFRWLGTETAAGLGYRYPRETDEEVTRWMERLRSQEIGAPSPTG